MTPPPAPPAPPRTPPGAVLSYTLKTDSGATMKSSGNRVTLEVWAQIQALLNKV